MTQRQRIQNILAEVAAAFALTVADLTGRQRDREIVLARQIAMLVLYRRGGLSLAAVGRHLGDRNHTTISHGIAVAEARVRRDAELARVLRRLLIKAPVAPAEARPARLPSSGEWWWLTASYGAMFAQQPARAA